MPVICPGRCNTAYRRAEVVGTPHELVPHWGQPVHCVSCRNRARDQLLDLPELVAAVWLEAVHGSPGPKVGTVGRSASEPPWPGQASRLLTDHIVGGLLDLEDDIRTLRHLHARRIGRTEGASVTSATRFLDTHLDWALTHHPLADEIHDRLSGNPASQIAGWHRAALRFTSRDRRVVHHRVPCPRCELLSLVREDGDDYIACRNPECGLLLTPAEFAQHVRQQAAAYGRDAAA